MSWDFFGNLVVRRILTGVQSGLCRVQIFVKTFFVKFRLKYFSCFIHEIFYSGKLVRYFLLFLTFVISILVKLGLSILISNYIKYIRDCRSISRGGFPYLFLLLKIIFLYEISDKNTDLYKQKIPYVHEVFIIENFKSEVKNTDNWPCTMFSPLTIT